MYIGKCRQSIWPKLALVLEEVVLWLAELVSEKELQISFPATSKLFSGELALNNGVSALRLKMEEK